MFSTKSVVAYQAGTPIPIFIQGVPPTLGNPAWGDITGDITDQPDLVAALDDKLTVADDSAWSDNSKFYAGDSFAVGDITVEGTGRIYKASGAYSAGLELDQAGGAGGFWLDIPGGTLAGPANFRVYGSVTGYTFDVAPTVGGNPLYHAGNLAVFTPTAKGLVPPSGGGSGKYLRADGVFAIPPLGPPSGSGTILWGGITGLLADQTDLQAALDLKANLVGGNAFTGNQSIAGNFTVAGAFVEIGPTSGAAADLDVLFDNTSGHSYLYFRNWTSGSAVTDGIVAAHGGNGLYLAGYPNVIIQRGGQNSLDLTAGGATFWVGGQPQFYVHSQGITIQNCTSSLIAAGTAAAPADTVFYFDNTNYYNLFYFRHWDGSAYSTQGQFVAGYGSGVQLYGFPAVSISVGTAAAPKRAAYFDAGQAVFNVPQVSFGNSSSSIGGQNQYIDLVSTGAYAGINFTFWSPAGVNNGLQSGILAYYGYGLYLDGNPDLHLRCGPDSVVAVNIHELTPTTALVTVAGKVIASGGVSVNSGNIASTTARNPGLYVFDSSTTQYGVELGYLSAPGQYTTRVFSQSGYVTICNISVASATLQSQFTDFATFSAAGLAVNGAVRVTDDPYSAGWNGSVEVPTKNAIYDKVGALTSLVAELTARLDKLEARQ